MSLSSMHEHEVEDITDWCIDFIKHSDWCNEFSKTQVLDTFIVSYYVLVVSCA